MVRSRTRARFPVALLVLVVSWAIGPGHCRAQDAIVLGGGGARGLAHAGVLVGLEERGVQPELVVGTSIGAVVGALYAAGYPAETVWRLIDEQDWNTIFQPMPVPLGAERRFRYPVLRVGTDDPSLRSPGGLIAEWQVNRMLVRFLFEPGARARGDFDLLPRRFRSVATDFESGELAVLGRGDLARAVRASMAVPGAFAPVQEGARILVDGGITDYLPIGVARALGASRVYAADVIRPPNVLEPYDPVEAISRALRMLVRHARRDTASADVLIVPNIAPTVSSVTFPRDPSELFRLGLDATLRAVEPRVPPDPGPSWRVEPPRTLAGLRVDAPERGLTALVERAFAPAVSGPYDPDAVLRAVDRLYATGLFDGIWPYVVPADMADRPVTDSANAGSNRLADDPVLVVRADAPAPTYVLGAAGYDNDRRARVWAQLRHRLGLPIPVELSLGGSFGSLERWGSLAVRWQSLVKPSLAWTVGGLYRHVEVRAFPGAGAPDAIDVQRAGGWFGAEWRTIAPDRFVVATLGAEYVDPDVGRRGASIGPLLRVGEPEPLARLVGWPLVAEAEARFGAVGYRRLRLGGSVPLSIGTVSIAPLADVSVVGGDAPADVQPALGDDLAIPGLRWDQERGRARVIAGADLAHPIPFEGYARLRLRAGAVADRPSGLDEEWVGGIGAGVFWWTPLGPIEAELGVNTEGHERLFINVGARF